jgi:hypothetical protein
MVKKTFALTFVLSTVEKAKSVNEDYCNLRSCAWLQHVFSRVMLLSETAMIDCYRLALLVWLRGSFN